MTTTSSSNGCWKHVDILLLFREAGVDLTPGKDDVYRGSHTYRHSSRSGKSLVVWPKAARWYCSSCKVSGDAADLLVDCGRAENRADAERILTERFGPPGTTEKPHLTDAGNAQRLVAAYGSHIRFCFPWGVWLIWDGKRWAVDHSGQIILFAKTVSQRLYAEASEIAAKAAGEPDADWRDTLSKQASAVLSWAKACESRVRIDAMVYLAQSEPGIPVLPTDLDADPWLLNVANGVLALKTGELLPHDPQRLITKLVPASYDPKARCPTWLSVLQRSMAGNQALVDFLQRAFGYAITGDVSEQVFFIFWGAGANGKGTIINSLL
jgi:putative DNA primase/helicase